MRRVGAYEAKTHLSALLDAVERGETIEITRHGRPIARLTPSEGGGGNREVIEKLRAVREQFGPTGITQDEVTQWIREGREERTQRILNPERE
ncbi:MAG: type II toxin-antitoxin system prevent-host-death family antitoxin [Dehalococcoidia bacterium]